jgi:hypothetical protein
VQRQRIRRHAIADTDSTTPAALWPFPDYRDLYVLVAGVLVGIVLSPAVLGQFAPAGWYSQFFGGQQIQQQVETLDQQYRQNQQALADSGVSKAAVEEARRDYQQKREQLIGALDAVRDQRAARMLVAIMLTLGLVMVVEPFLSPQPDQTRERAAVPRALGRLKTVRYALVAIFAALLLARPGLLASSTLAFSALLVLVALGVGLVPLGKRTST